MDSYDIKVAENLGDIELVKIEKKKYWMHDDWYCKYITVKTPIGDYIEFPCFRWLVDDKEVVLRDGRGGILLLCLHTRGLLNLYDLIALKNCPARVRVKKKNLLCAFSMCDLQLVCLSMKKTELQNNTDARSWKAGKRFTG